MCDFERFKIFFKVYNFLFHVFLIDLKFSQSYNIVLVAVTLLCDPTSVCCDNAVLNCLGNE
jgi:hypothetical protein